MEEVHKAIENVRQLVAANQLKAALAKVEEIAKIQGLKNVQKDVILLRRKFEENKRSGELDIESSDQISQVNTKISNAILGLLEKFDVEETVSIDEPEAKPIDAGMKSNRRLVIVFISIAVLFIFSFGIFWFTSTLEKENKNAPLENFLKETGLKVYLKEGGAEFQEISLPLDSLNKILDIWTNTEDTFRLQFEFNDWQLKRYDGLRFCVDEELSAQFVGRLAMPDWKKEYDVQCKLAFDTRKLERFMKFEKPLAK